MSTKRTLMTAIIMAAFIFAATGTDAAAQKKKKAKELEKGGVEDITRFLDENIEEEE